jgi:hypothetical protein
MLMMLVIIIVTHLASGVIVAIRQKNQPGRPKGTTRPTGRALQPPSGKSSNSLGRFYLVAAGDWFGSQHLGHSPREAPYVYGVRSWYAPLPQFSTPVLGMSVKANDALPPSSHKHTCL